MLFMKDNTFLVGAILASSLIVAGSLIYVFGPERAVGPSDGGGLAITLPPFETRLPYNQTPTPGGDILLGDPNAPVEIVGYSDYQCSFCVKFALETGPQIRENYIATGKAKMIYKDLIVVDGFVDGGHESTDAALAANCAADQGKFWEYHDALFIIESIDQKTNNGNLTKDLFMAIADKLELDEAAFEDCYDSKKYAGEVESDTAEAENDLPQLSTPSTLVNGELISGAQPYAIFAAVIDKFLK